jgi:hypothetical protein
MRAEQDVWTDERSNKRRSNKAIAPRIDQSPRMSAARRRDGKRGDQSESPHAAAKARGKRLLELDNNSCRWLIEAALKWAVDRALSHFQ